LTVIGLTGIAVANVLMPAWIKIHGRQHTVKLMTIYSVCVVAAGALGAATTAPLAAAFSAIISPDARWRAALSTWGLVVVVPLVLWWIMNERVSNVCTPSHSHHNATRELYRAPAAWAMTASFGLQSTQVYAQFGWLPQIYREAGLGSTEAGLLLATTAS